ncbi:MAG: hypothetical protein JWN66_5020 [Sphingomonas bacterium]|nr:hypothetical protein [Sphingomonas bacterium]
MTEGRSADDFIIQGLDPITETASVEWRVRIAAIDGLERYSDPIAMRIAI